MLDFNQAEQQTTGTGPIPPDSCVILQAEIRTPRAGKQGSHPLLCVSAKGNEYLDMEFKVVRGAFAGKEIWNNFTVAGSEQAAKISMRTLRAMVESARGIDPSDQSPAATSARMLSDWSDFQGLQFMARVDAKCEQNVRDGRWYTNNSIKRVITPDMEEYAIIAQQGEIITDNPLPVQPTEGTAPVAKPTAAPAWGAPAAPAAPAVVPATGPVPPTAPAANPVPAWARK